MPINSYDMSSTHVAESVSLKCEEKLWNGETETVLCLIEALCKCVRPSELPAEVHALGLMIDDEETAEWD